MGRMKEVFVAVREAEEQRETIELAACEAMFLESRNEKPRDIAHKPKTDEKQD